MKSLLITMLLSLNCFAGDGKIEKLYGQIGDEVRQQMNMGLSSLEGMSNFDPNQKQWMLKKFMLRIQAMFGFDVPFLASLKVVPEVEIIAEKK